MDGANDRWNRSGGLRSGHRDRHIDMVRQATFLANGRKIVLNSPTNLARIPHVLRISQAARFVNIVRSPYTVYSSLVNKFRKLTAAWTRRRPGRHAKQRMLIK